MSFFENDMSFVENDMQQIPQTTCRLLQKKKGFSDVRNDTSFARQWQNDMSFLPPLSPKNFSERSAGSQL
uniref:Uncharacterized protein n=1 Tax=Cannabis sativa TaxID=3483 RepID=A0A803R3K9_CANSA